MLLPHRIQNLACLAICLFLCARATAQNAPLQFESLVLSDGRKLTKVVVKSYDPAAAKVLLIAKGTAMSIPLELLPVPARDQVKESAAKAGSSTSSTSPTAPPPAPVKLIHPYPDRPVQIARLTDPEAHKQAALERARNYYRYEFQVGSNAVRITALNFETDDPEAVPGWSNRYHIQGRVLLEYFDSRGYSFSRTTDRFEITTEQKPGASVKVIDFSRQ